MTQTTTKLPKVASILSDDDVSVVDWGSYQTVGRAYPYIGTLSGCRTAVDAATNDIDRGMHFGGLKGLGGGAFRLAYTDGHWVYKVCRDHTEDWGSLVEYQYMLALKRMHFKYIGPVNLWVVSGYTVTTLPLYPRPVTDSLQAMADLRDIKAHDTVKVLLERAGVDVNHWGPWYDVREANSRATAAGRLRVIDMGGIDPNEWPPFRRQWGSVR